MTKAEVAGRNEREILWLQDFLYYRIPVAASYMLRETAMICAKQAQPLTIAQWRIISILANHPSLLATEISRISMLDQVAISRALTALVRRGLVQRKQNRQDKRAREVSLTEAGWASYDKVMPLMRQQNEVLRGLFSQAELNGLYDSLDKIDTLFKELSQQRRLYGDGIDLGDVAP